MPTIERRADNFTEGQLAILDGRILKNLPCGGQNECKEVESVKRIGKGILVLLTIFIIGLAINYVKAEDTIQRQNDKAEMQKAFLSERLDRIDFVMGIKK